MRRFPGADECFGVVPLKLVNDDLRQNDEAQAFCGEGSEGWARAGRRPLCPEECVGIRDHDKHAGDHRSEPVERTVDATLRGDVVRQLNRRCLERGERTRVMDSEGLHPGSVVGEAVATPRCRDDLGSFSPGGLDPFVVPETRPRVWGVEGGPLAEVGVIALVGTALEMRHPAG